eukprot:g28946.t1
MRCLEEKLVHELLEHRRDWKELDHFQGQLTSVLEPLYHMMQVPSQPEMSAMRALLPCLDDFLQNTRPQQVDAPRPKHAVRNSRERTLPKAAAVPADAEWALGGGPWGALRNLLWGRWSPENAPLWIQGAFALPQRLLVPEGVITREDLQLAEQTVREVDERNQRLIEELKRQSEEYRPTFRCAICLVDHEVEGCCTLPCQHRFCFESLQYHFDLIVRERRLSKLTCPAEGCGYNLRSEDSIHIFQQCLPEESYYKLLEFLTRDDPHIVDCRALGCEEQRLRP